MATDDEVKQYKLACLKFIAINLCQMAVKNNLLENMHVIDIRSHITSKIDDPTDKELTQDPETLFEPPKKTGASPRNKHAYDENNGGITAAIQAPEYPKPTEAEKTEVNSLTARIIVRKNDIKEHARRRVELFFLLCIALYKTDRVITTAPTVDQYGESRNGYDHAACHSSLFTTIDDKAGKVRTKTAIASDKSILAGTHFAKELNSTIEFHKGVNSFDCLIEGKNSARDQGLRRKLLPTLNQVSSGTISPLEAMTTFFNLMQAFFTSSELATKIATPSAVYSPPQARTKIKKYQETGTFYWANEDKTTPLAESLSCWLRISASKAEEILADPAEAEPHYARIQQEILTCS